MGPKECIFMGLVNQKWNEAVRTHWEYKNISLIEDIEMYKVIYIYIFIIYIANESKTIIF